MLGLYQVKEYERLVIFRLGHLLSVCGPGLFITIPLVDRAIRVNLNTHIPGWQDLPESELEERVRQLALSGVK